MMPTGRYPHKPPPTLQERADFFRRDGTTVAEQIGRAPRRSNLVRLWFGTLKLIALVGRKLKGRKR